MKQMFIIAALLCGLVFSGSSDDEIEAMMKEMAWKIPLREQERARWGNSSPSERMARIRELSAENTETNKVLLGEIFTRLPQAVPSTAGNQKEKTAAFQGLLPMFPPPIAKCFALSTLAKEIGALHAARWEGQDARYPADLMLTAAEFLAQSPTDPDVVEVFSKYAGDNWIREDVKGRFQKHLSDWQTKHTQAVAEAETNAVQEATPEPAQPPVAIETTPPDSVPATDTQSPPEPKETKATLWQLPLLIGIIAIIGAITAWRYLRKK